MEEGDLIEIYYNPHFKFKGYFKKIENNYIYVKDLKTQKLDFHNMNMAKVCYVNTKHTIYMVTNLINGKKYIGRTTGNIDKRLRQHKNESKQPWSQTPLHIDIQKYGIENFIIQKLYEIKADTQKIANRTEQFFIRKFNTKQPFGYNVV